MATMTIGAITTGVQSVTATGAVTPTGGLDVSGITGDYTLFVQVQAQTAAKGFQLQLEESVNAFTASIADMVVSAKGGIAAGYDRVFSKRKYELPQSGAIGTASGVLRMNVKQLDSADTIGVRAWIEY
jgi:hypothetical protein